MWHWIKKFFSRGTPSNPHYIIAYAGGYMVRAHRLGKAPAFWHKDEPGTLVLDIPGEKFENSTTKILCWVPTIEEARAIKDRNWMRRVE